MYLQLHFLDLFEMLFGPDKTAQMCSIREQVLCKGNPLAWRPWLCHWGQASSRRNERTVLFGKLIWAFPRLGEWQLQRGCEVQALLGGRASERPPGVAGHGNTMTQVEVHFPETMGRTQHFARCFQKLQFKQDFFPSLFFWAYCWGYFI